MIELVDVGIDHPRGGAPLVSGANLRVGRGEVVLVVGAAGVGTSRLAAAALGEVPLARGRLEILGRDVAKLRRASLRLLRRRIGIVPQDLCLLGDRSALLNVVLPLEIDGVPRAASLARAAEILARLDLDAADPLPVEALSASARQRVAVARALVREPDLVVADHPTSAQDALGADLVCTAIQAAAVRGAACIVLGRDPALRQLGELYGWRPLALAAGALAPLGELAPEVLAALEREPAPADAAAAEEPADERAGLALPNVLPFPITARTAAGLG